MLVRFLKNHLAAAIAILAIVGATVPSFAQTPAQPSPGSLLIAKQIVQLKGINAMMDPVARGVVEKVKSTVMQTNFMFQKDIDEVTVQLHKEFDSRSTELVDQTAQVYASHFSEAELKQILAFYQSPLGQKVIAEEPKVMDESLKEVAGWADNLSIDIMARMREEMKKRGHDI